MSQWSAFRIAGFGLVLLLLDGVLPAQHRVEIEPPSRVRVSERSNLSYREDGRYTGLTSTQVTGYLTQAAADPRGYVGRFFRYQQVRRDTAAVARTVDESAEIGLKITRSELFAVDAFAANGAGFPSLQGVPSLPDRSISPGAAWSAPALYVIRPKPGLIPMHLPVTVTYRFIGTEQWNGAEAFRIEAQFAARYPLRIDDDEEGPVMEYSGPIASVEGSHRLTILIPAGAGGMLMVRDDVQEQYRFDTGNMLSAQGHSLLFVAGLSASAGEAVAERIDEEIDRESIEGVAVDTTTTGVRLTINALRFYPDSAQLLPDERGRIAEIARLLVTVENSRFLIVGHTAEAGTEEGRRTLSIERARTIAAELSSRGVHPDRIDIEGRGAREPVAPNDTDAGRALNRRVEIFILEE